MRRWTWTGTMTTTCIEFLPVEFEILRAAVEMYRGNMEDDLHDKGSQPTDSELVVRNMDDAFQNWEK